LRAELEGEVADFYVGLDLGQSNDYTALAVIQKVPPFEETAKHELHLRHLERYALKTPYTTIADHVRDLLQGPPFTEDIREGNPGRFGFVKVRKPQTELVVDRTGVGVAVTDLLKERNLRFIGVTITGLGQKVNSTGVREYSVPKQDLVAALEVPFHTGKLKIAEDLELWPALREELLNFRRKQNARTTHISYEHWRESDHDDLVLAAALACWKATYKRKGTARLVIY
jgi:hypothetical protein